MQDTVFFRTTSTDLDEKAVADCCSDDEQSGLRGLTSVELPRMPTRPSLLKMRCEQARLQTFGYNWSFEWARLLSAYGFYCVVRPHNVGGQCVRCAFCGLEISQFSSPNDARNKHTQAARAYCPFLIGMDIDRRVCCSSSSHNSAAATNCHPGFYTPALWETKTRDLGTDRTGDHKSHTANGLLEKSETEPARRRDSTKHVGAAPIISPSQNAGARFGDTVFPPSSSVNHDLQQPRSDPTQMMSLHPPRHHHQTQSPSQAQSSSMPFQNQNPETPRPASSSLPSTPTQQIPASHSTQRRSSFTSQPRPMTWEYVMRTSRYPQMASFQARLDSLLKTWPLPTPTPRELAKAGLFHVPSGIVHDPDAPATDHHSSPPSTRLKWSDSVKCFWCGERLNRWQVTDDAMVEHARLSPGCRYVIQVLGKTLHDDITKFASHTSSNRYHASRHQQPPQSSQRTPPPPSAPPAQTPPRLFNVDQAMKSIPVKTVLQMGFSSRLIRELLSSRTLAPHQLTADYLCELALQATEASNRELSGTLAAGTGLETPWSPTAARSKEAGERTVSAVSSRNNTAALVPPSGGLDPKVTCKVCSAAEIKVTFRPCNHLLCCSACADHFTSCPLCHAPIEDKLTTYLA